MILHSVTDYPIPVLLKKIMAYRLSGTLHIKVEDVEKSIYFIDGNLVSAKSTKLDESIAVILHLTGKINEKQYDNISGLLYGSDQEVGEILVQNNFVSSDDLRTAAMYLARRITLSTFLLEKGTWQFDSENAEAKERKQFVIPLLGIIAEGARKLRSTTYFKDKIYFHAPMTVGIVESLYSQLTDEEIHFYRELEKCKGLSNGEIISKLNLLPGFYWEKIIVFLMLDMIEFEEHAIEFDRAEAIKNLLEISERLKSGELDKYSILGVEKTASKDEIEVSYREKFRLYHPDHFGTTATSEIKKIARFVLDGIVDAYHALIKTEKEKVLEKEQKGESVKDELSAREEPNFKANRLFGQAQNLYNEKKYHDAVLLLKNVVKLDPTRSKYFHLLGACQSELFYFHGDAERNLRKAIEMEPWNADPVYALGLLFRKQNKLKLSEKCFQRALDIDRSRSDAGRAIAEIQKRKSVERKGSFFSLFKDKQH